MKLFKGLILLFFSTILLTSCIPDTWTKWKVSDPTSPDGSIPGLPPGVTPPPDGGDFSTPPTDIAYTPPSAPTGTPEGQYFWTQTSQIDDGAIDPLTMIALNGGEIKEGDMSFFVSLVRDKNNIILPTKSLPTGLTLNPLTGGIDGFAQVFTDGNFYTIQGDHILGSSVNTTIQISIATKPSALFYPQVNGLSLVLNVDKPENFKVGNIITSNRNAQGVVTYVDEENKILHVEVNFCQSANPADCPYFAKDDEIDNTTGFFLAEAKIEEEVTYAYQNTVNISNMVPVVVPAVDGENPQFSISPDIEDFGIDFNPDTGEIFGIPEIGTCSINPTPPLLPYKTRQDCEGNGGVWTPITILNVPKTLFTVTVKNILGETANVTFNLSSLDVTAPQAISSISYDYLPGYRVALNVANLRPFSKGGSITNQDKTAGTILDLDDIEDSEPSGQVEDLPGQMLVEIKAGSLLKFSNSQAVDDTDPFVLPSTTIGQEPILVFLLGQNVSIPVTVEPTLDPTELESLKWISDPILPHLCNSVNLPDVVFYPEETSSTCTNNNGICSGGTSSGNEANKAACDLVTGTWTTDGNFNSTKELFFNRETGYFGAKNPEKAFVPQKFDVTVTSLDGTETKTEVTFSFQSAPEELSYSDQAILEVDNFSVFQVNDYISSSTGALGIIKSREVAQDLDPDGIYEDVNILIVKVLAGEFEQFSNIDNNRIFTFQKARVDKVKYGQLGLNVGNAGLFEVGEEVTHAATGVTGIVQYRQTVGNPIIWVRLITLDDTNPLLETFATGQLIVGADSNTNDTILGVFGDVLNITHSGLTTFTAGMDVAANPMEGFGMVNSADTPNDELVLSQASGIFLPGNNLFRMNPFDTQNPPSGGQASSPIQEVAQVQTFYIDRGEDLPVEPVLISPENNGVTFSIEPPLPEGLSLDEETGEISITEDSNGPVASTLDYYTVVAKNLIGQTETKFGLKVREVFAIRDVTGLDEADEAKPNLTSVLHKSGQGYNNFNCRVTEDQINLDGTLAWSSKAKDIVCIYDVGEADLHFNGLQLKMDTGTDLCQYIEHVPVWFYQYQVLTTDPATVSPVVQNSGDWLQTQCGVAQLNGERVEFPDGLPVESCIGNYSVADETAPNCDTGSVPTLQRDFAVFDTCVDPRLGEVNTTDNYEDCFNSGGVCSWGGGAITDRDTCLAGNAANPAPSWNSDFAFVQDTCYQYDQGIDNRTDCENNIGNCTPDNGETSRALCDAAVGAWTPAGIWTDNSSCQSTAGIVGEEIACDGDAIACIAGPAKDDPDFPSAFLTDRFDNDAFGNVIPVDNVEPIKFSYASPRSKQYRSNLYLTNYSRRNSCTPYGIGAPGAWTGNDYEYDINTWTDVGKDWDPNEVADADQNPFAGGNGVYDYRCLDGARNVKARIRLLIREWDWNFKPGNTVDVMNLIGPGNLPPGPWPDGDLMDAPWQQEDDQGFPANAYNDWDDQNLDPTTGASIGGTCGDPSYNYPEGDL